MQAGRLASAPVGPAAGERRVAPEVRLAALIYFVLGLGFAAGTVWTLWHLDRTGELPMTPWGFRSLDGPVVQLGPERFKLLCWALIATTSLDAVAGAWLWQGRQRGARLGMATSPFTFLLAAGFALPFLLVGVPARLILTVLGRRSLR
jgi:hypothetical protein